MTRDPIAHGLRWLSAEFVVPREQAQRELGPMLTEGLVARGFARLAPDGRLTVTEAGRRRLSDTPEETEA